LRRDVRPVPLEFALTGLSRIILPKPVGHHGPGG
jgi:hypothetical protein